ncbi:hypothetical protein VKT23_010406 [Stygiomarasmius scandens]|uniref:Uncharacterized protein n=1 Tax=Marasmiellus scandens TaxID=2682957 RepID=A0ABR1JE77_9AGAR
MSVPETFDAFVPSAASDLISRATFQARYVPLSVLRDLDFEKQFKASYDFSQKISSIAVFNHCLRSYYFSLLILHSGFPSNTPGVAQISRDELFKRIFLTSVLHDVALSHDKSVLSHPAHAMSFELQGGIMTYEHLHEKYPSLDAAQVGDVVQGIMLHTTQFARGTSSAVGILIQLSTAFDLLGYNGFGPGVFEHMLDRDSVREIEEAFPRENVKDELVPEFTEMLKEKPNCLISHSDPDLLKKMKAVDSLVDSN